MKKILLITALLTPFLTNAEEKKDFKMLTYQYNDKVVIAISNATCPFKEHQKEYPNEVRAFRIDGAIMKGCYGKKNEDIIKIQWYKGDTSEFPANAFLLKPVTAEPKATM